MNENNDEKYRSITEAAQAVGVSVTTLRRWEWMGRITPKRLAHGTRIYSDSDIELLRRLKGER